MEPHRLIGPELKSLTNMIKRRLTEGVHAIEGYGVTSTQAWMIRYLAEHKNGEVLQRDLETQFHIRRSTVTDILQTMERNGFVERRSVACDRRLKKIVLTEKAVSVNACIIERLNTIENSLRSSLTDEEVAQFFSIIDKMKNNME